MSEIERVVWEPIGAGWRQLYGSMRARGLSIELHEFRSETALDWGASFHRDCLEICLNLEGRGEVDAGGEEMRLGPGMVGLYARALEPVRAVRPPRERHRFITIELSHAWLARALSGHEGVMLALLRETLFATPPRGGVGLARPMTLLHEQIAAALQHPPVGLAGRGLWFEGKVLELLSDVLFATSDDFFCDRQKRIARTRVSRVKEILTAKLEEPPSLDELARQVGISAFHLSRTFSQETGMTIPQFLRRTRIERAAELIRSGTHNVSEAAFAVGYASLGHFSKSFCEVMGVCPALYPQARDNGKQRSGNL